MSVPWAILLLFVLAAEQTVKGDDCRKREVVSNFNLAAFMNKWYFFKEHNARSLYEYWCKEVTFTDKGDGSFRYEETATIGSQRRFGQRTSFATTLVPHETKNGTASTARFNYWDDDQSGNVTGPAKQFNIIAVRYNKFAIVSECSDGPIWGKQEAIHILTRARVPSKRIQLKAIRIVRKVFGKSKSSELITMEQRGTGTTASCL